MKVLVLILTLTFSLATYSECSQTQVQVFVDGLMLHKEGKWEDSAKVRKQLYGSVHRLLFNRGRNIRSGKRTAEERTKASDLFVKIQDLISLSQSENPAEYLEQLVMLRKATKESKSLAEKEGIIDRLLSDQRKVARDIDRLLTIRETEFSDNFSLLQNIESMQSRSSPEMGLVSRLSDDSRLKYSERQHFIYLSNFYKKSRINSLLWSSWINTFKGDILRDAYKIQNLENIREMGAGQLLSSERFREVLIKRLKEARVPEELALDKLDIDHLIKLDLFRHFTATRGETSKFSKTIKWMASNQPLPGAPHLRSGMALSFLVEKGRGTLTSPERINPLIFNFIGEGKSLRAYKSEQRQKAKRKISQESTNPATKVPAAERAKIDQVFTQRQHQLEQDLSKITNTTPISRVRGSFTSPSIKPHIKKLMEVLFAEMQTAETWSSWAKELREAVIAEYQLPHNAQKYKQFLIDFKMDRVILKQVLQKRSKEAGFSGAIHEIRSEVGVLPPGEFASILRQGKLIVDKPLERDSHGEFIHMFQVDLMIKIAKSKGMKPEFVREFYQYMGQMKEMGNGMLSLQLWDTFFDQFNNSSFFRPEDMNPIIERYLNL